MPMPARRHTDAGPMADTRTNKTKDEWISWKNRPYASSRSDENQRRAELWESFNAY
jgi:hypothetical protein